MSASVVALALVLGPAPAGEAEPAPEAPTEDLSTKRADATPGSIEDLYYKGAANYSASDYGQAIEKFTQALDLAGRQGTEPGIRAALLFNLARAHTRAFDVDGDARHLRQAVDIHRRFIEEAGLLQLEVPEQIAAAEAEIEVIQARLERLEREGEQDTATLEGASGPAAAAPASSGQDQVARRHKRGIALTVSGAVGLGAGVAVAVYGTSFRRDALDTVGRIDDPPEQEQRFVSDETRKGRVWIGVGAATAAVGTGLLIWGIVDLVAAKRAGAVGVTPTLGAGMAGLSVVGQF